MDSKLEAFLKEYGELCHKHGFFIDIDPFCTLTISPCTEKLDQYLGDLRNAVE